MSDALSLALVFFVIVIAVPVLWWFYKFITSSDEDEGIEDLDDL